MKRKQFIALGLTSLGLPGWSKLEAANYPAFSVAAGKQMIKYGQQHVGQRVAADSKGECTDFISAALKAVGAKGGDFSKEPYYTWGSPIKATGGGLARPWPGEIVQFVNCTFKGDNWTQSFPKHSALIESANGWVATLLHQNVNGQRVVVRSTLDMSKLVHDGGTYKMFGVIPAYA